MTITRAEEAFALAQRSSMRDANSPAFQAITGYTDELCATLGVGEVDRDIVLGAVKTMWTVGYTSARRLGPSQSGPERRAFVRFGPHAHLPPDAAAQLTTIIDAQRRAHLVATDSAAVRAHLDGGTPLAVITGAALHTALHRIGLTTTREVGAALGVGEETVRTWRRGKGNPGTVPTQLLHALLREHDALVDAAVVALQGDPEPAYTVPVGDDRHGASWWYAVATGVQHRVPGVQVR